MSQFKNYRNKETGKEIEGELKPWYSGWLFNGKIYLTKRHFKSEWVEVKNES